MLMNIEGPGPNQNPVENINRRTEARALSRDRGAPSFRMLGLRSSFTRVSTFLTCVHCLMGMNHGPLIRFRGAPMPQCTGRAWAPLTGTHAWA